MKKIAIVIPLLRGGGGAEKIATWLADRLVDAGYDVHCIYFKKGDNELEIKGHKHCLNEEKFRSIFGLIRVNQKVREICKIHNIETIIAFTELAGLGSLLANRRLLLAIRNNPKQRGVWSQLVNQILYLWVSRVIVNSKDMKKLVRGVRENKIEVIHNPCNLDLNDKLSLESLPVEIINFVKDKKVFLNIGRLIPQKGQKDLLLAFKEVSARFADAVLLIVGRGMMENELKALTRELGLENQVFFTGFVENVYPYLRRADCFVFPSYWEGFPNALLDALSLGKDIISYDCETGPREILSESLGTLVPVGNVEMLALAMIEEIENNFSKEKFEATVKRSKDFNPEAIASLWQKTLESNALK